MGFAQQIADLTKSVNGLITTVKGQTTKWNNAVNGQIAKLESFLKDTRSQFVGTQLFPTDWHENIRETVGYGNSGVMKTTSANLIHMDNNTKVVDADGNENVYPKHPQGNHPYFNIPGIIVDIEDMDNERHFQPYLNLKSFGSFVSTKGSSQSGLYIFASRDCVIGIGGIPFLHWHGTQELFIDDKLVDKNRVELSSGWHKIESFGHATKAETISPMLNIFRIWFDVDDSLEPIKLIVTSPTFLADKNISAVLTNQKV